MKTATQSFIILLVGVNFVFGFLLFQETPFSRQVQARSENEPARVIVQEAPVSEQTRERSSYSSVVERMAPSVVNIFTSRLVRDTPETSPLLDPFLRRFLGGEDDHRGPQFRQEQSLGSGVVVSENGYILSSFHIVDGADEIRVQMADGRQLLARVVGADPQTDVAVLKVETSGLPAAVMTDSANLRVGDVVFAIGNPFGVGQTVTMGIVSAVERSGFRILDYEDFIQTDASINPGNSGGALVDAEGRLVGINTAIISRTGGAQGIGFAIPINLARYVMEQLIEDGRVVRGFLGVNIQSLTPAMAEFFQVSNSEGALVSGVTHKTPAADAGLLPGDVIIGFNGDGVASSRQLRLLVAQTRPGKVVPLILVRGGETLSLEVKLSELPRSNGGTPFKAPKEAASEPVHFMDGLGLGDLGNRLRRQLEVPGEIEGAVITSIEPASPCYAAGLRPGAVIVEINRLPVRNAEEARSAGKRLPPGPVLLRVWSEGGTMYTVVNSLKG
jgi:serine protease Do